MADIEKVIKGLEFTKAMITFHPLTGKNIEPENLNETNKTTYDACVGAIELLNQQPQIVRCKDCIYPKNGICHNAKTFGAIIKDDWFCADGKPKEEQKEEPVKTVTPEFGGGGSLWWIQCSECGHMLHSLQIECPGCHNKINWEGWI